LAALIYQQTGGTIDVRGQLGAKNQGRMAPMARNVQELYLAEPKAAATAQGRITTELQNEPATTAAAAREAAAVKGATTVAGTQAERQMGATTPVGNATVADAGVWGALTDAQRSKGIAAAEARAVFDHALTTMLDIADRNGSQNLPSADKAAYDAAHGAALGQLSNLYHTGVINKFEYERMADRLPQSGGIKSIATDVYGQVSGQPKLIGDVARGSGTETLAELGTIMAQYGLAPPTRPQQAKPQPSAAPDPVTNGLVNPTNPLQLTDTGGRRDVPQLPTAPPMKQYPNARTTVTQGAAGGVDTGVELQPTGMPDGSFYAIDKATGRRKRISKESAARFQGGM
jgi:hypothetical protein